ncbi:MAG: glycosyltransferase [Myxococcota bacterium]|nr:glycosyltransferase [Myxococcota bacterium]
MGAKRIKKRLKRTKRPLRSKPLLSLAMMVKNEEEFLEDALKSAQPFCDELIVVDTGSTDRTVEIARDLGAKVSFFEWCNNFSKARNETLKRATGQWVAILDADERFQGQKPESIRQFLKPGPSFPFQALMVNVVNTRLDGSPISSFFSVRFFPNHPRLGYSGRVHNRFGALGHNPPKVEATRYLGLEIVHLGYDPALYKARQKAARSLPLIEATVREEPSNHQQRFYLGREYLLLNRIDDAVAALTLAFEGIEATGAGPLADTATHLMQALARNQAHDDVLKVGQRALAHAPNHPDIWFEFGQALMHCGDLSTAAEAYEKALAGLSAMGSEAQTRLIHHRWKAHEMLGLAYFKTQQYQASYTAYLRALDGKPEGTDGWPVLLNSVCALGIELGDDARVPILLDRLLRRADTPLAMFFFQLKRVVQRTGQDAGRTMLLEAIQVCPRITEDPEYHQWAHLIGHSP